MTASDRMFQVLVIGCAVLVAVAFGWLYHVSRAETSGNTHAIAAACESDNANRVVLRHVLKTLRTHPTLPLTLAQTTKRNALYDGLIASITLESCDA